MKKIGKLYLMCGKMGAGKTTYAKQLSEKIDALYIAEDEWLRSLYPGEINDFNDYIAYSVKMKPMVKEHITKLLLLGVSVVMDFPGNTKRQRAWLLSIASDINAPHELLYLDVSDEKCLIHLKKRNKEEPDRNEFDTEAVFQQVTKYFEEPNENEGLNITVI